VTIIVGLGNPGSEYERTPHNIGFRVVEALAAGAGLAWARVRDGCRVARGTVAGSEVVLVEPLLYMNRSGEALRRWARAEGIVLGGRAVADGDDTDRDAAVAPLVVCDDIALPLGSLRLRRRGGPGGHRGLESLVRVLGGEEFPRCRLGVGPLDGELPAERWSDYVLEPFDDAAWEESEQLVGTACEALETYLREGYEAAASRFNRRVVIGD